MKTTSLLKLGVFVALPLACSSLKDADVMPPARGDGKILSGTSTGSAGADDSGTSGGQAGGDSSSAGSGQTQLSSGGATTPDNCSKDAGLVCVEVADARVLFVDATGAQIDAGETPRQHPLPEGGMVTVIKDGQLTSYVGVPAGTEIRQDPPGDPPPEKYVQSIEFTVHQFEDEPAKRTLIWTGCNGGVPATFDVAQTLQITEDCLEDGKAELVIETLDHPVARIHVKGIELGDVSLPPKEITLPPWEEEGTGTFKGSFTLTGLPHDLTGQVGFVSFYGSSAVTNSYVHFTRTAQEPTADFDLNPRVGTQWWRSTFAFPLNRDPLHDVFSESWDPIGYPLSAKQTKAYASMVPTPQVSLDGRSVSISGITEPRKLDRVLTKVSFDDDNSTVWRIWSPPDSPSFTLPEVEELEHATITQVVVRLEDASDVEGYAQAFEVLSNGKDVGIADPWRGPEKPFRAAQRTLVVEK